ncbi:MAG: wax ester/triacylglycerol synthase family O-acyltransferase [Acidimicrobiales bacterium]
MKQLSGLDAGFLYMESPTTYGHVNSLSIYQRPRTRSFRPYELVRERLAAKLGDLAPLRRRLVEVPFQIDHPWWIDDPAFDLDFHLRHIAVPPPGEQHALAELVGRIISRPLDRSHPLWEAYVIEGLAGQDWALLLKFHHAAIDGAAGLELLTILLDPEPDAGPLPPADLGPGERVPTPSEMLGRTAFEYALRPERFLRAQLRTLRDASTIANERRAELYRASLRSWAQPALPFSLRPDVPRPPEGMAPPTPFNRAISPHRRFAYRTESLAAIKDIKNRYGVTVNDVIMAICAGALRRYLARHDQLTGEPLVAAVPVSIRTGDEDDPWTNRVSSIVAPLPTHLDTPQARVAYAHEAMADAKARFDLIPADALQDFSRFSPPALFTQASALMARTRMADRTGSPVNLVISNVPGPRHPLYLGPARLEHYYPVSTIAEGQGLNITVHSYQDILDIGLVGCRELMPDIWDLLELIGDEVQALLDHRRVATPVTA